jgi:hypothetical protein
MARAAGRHTPQEWEEIGRQALLDLLGDKHVVPWPEAEARISMTGWKDFEPVQPLQLMGARRSLQERGQIVVETTQHTPAVTTLRLPFLPGRKREIERLRGERRKLYRKYLSWAQDGNLCGKHAERVVLDSAKAAASEAGLWVPPQNVGAIHEVNGVPIRRGPLDVLAHILAVPQPTADAALVIEVKNIHSWVYPWTTELWELLVKASELGEATPVVPVLVCVRSAYQTNQMAKDIGFLGCYLGQQLFSLGIDATEFSAMVEEFGLVISQREGPVDPVIVFLTKTLRRSPPWSPPPEDIPFYRRQVERFRTLAPVIRKYEALADGSVTGKARRTVFGAFRAEARARMPWPRVGGW